MELMGRVFVLTGAYLFTKVPRTEHYCWVLRDRFLVSLLDPNRVYFSEQYFFLVPFCLTTVNLWYARKIVWNNCYRKKWFDRTEKAFGDWRSSQRPWTWVGKLTCCLRSKHERILLKLLLFLFELSRGKFKSPIIYKLSWSEIMFPIRADIALSLLKDGRRWISVLN